MRVAILVQYDGSAYHGWQIQPGNQTVQGVIEAALAKVFDRQIGTHASGRTDAGVHALGQVFHFDIESARIPAERQWMLINRYLPRDIRLLDSQEVDANFHSRFNAKQREYRYQITRVYDILRRNTHWFVRHDLDLNILKGLSAEIRGRHDFSSFCYAGTETENMICNVNQADWHVHSDGSLTLRIAADRFLHHMVRMLVGSMVEVARGKWGVDNFLTLLATPDRQNHAVTAPATGLALMRVSYPEDLQPLWQTGKGNIVIPKDVG